MLALTGDITVFKKEGKTAQGREWKLFSTTIGSKDQDGKYTNFYLNVNFTKDVDVSKFGEQTKILVQDAFLSTTPAKDKEGKDFVRLDLVIKKAKVL